MLESFDKMIINPHPKHSTRLLKCFETAELSSDRASPFRSAAGLRLYLSCDMVKCQWATRHLAQSMSRPTEKAWIELRHLVQYVLGCMSFVLLVHYRSDYDTSDLLLKIFIESDWASNQGTCKSFSACCIMASTCLLHSANRNYQGLIALSSAEAETYAGTSGACQAYFLPKAWNFLSKVQ